MRKALDGWEVCFYAFLIVVITALALGWLGGIAYLITLLG